VFKGNASKSLRGSKGKKEKEDEKFEVLVGESQFLMSYRVERTEFGANP